MIIDNNIISQQDGKWFIADMFFRFENRIAKTIGFFLPDIMNSGKVRYFF